MFHPLYNHFALACGLARVSPTMPGLPETPRSISATQGPPRVSVLQKTTQLFSVNKQALVGKWGVPGENAEGELATDTPEHPIQMCPTEAAISGRACVEQRPPPGH